MVDWELVLKILGAIISGLTLISIAWGLFYAIRSFGLKREKFSFLTMSLDANVIKQVGDLLLVSSIVHLENRGQTRISARKHQDIDKKRVDFLYDDGLDQCRHAGTLKIRGMPDKHQTELFDWYSLQPINKISVLKDKQSQEGDLEQINYLYEDEDPKAQYQDVDFWLEPNETYNLQIMVWLPPGTYAMKAYFLGKGTEYREEEYWSVTRLFDLKVNKEKTK